MRARQLINKPAWQSRLPLPIDPAICRKRNRANFFCAGDAHIGQAPLFLQTLEATFVHRALRGKETIFPTRQKHHREFKALGRMQRHDRNLCPIRLLFIVHNQTDMLQKPLQVFKSFQRLDQLFEVFQAPRRLWRFVILPMGGVATFIENYFCQLHMGVGLLAGLDVPAVNAVDQTCQFHGTLAAQIFRRQQNARTLHQRHAIAARGSLDFLLRFVP